MSDSMSIYHQIQQIYVLLDDGDRRALRTSGLTPTQYNLLSRLGERADKGVKVSELAQLLLCTKGNATRLVQRLAQQGLVEVGGDANDQRVVRVALTDEGASRLAQARQAHDQAVERRFGLFPPDMRRQFRELTQMAVESLTADLEKQSD
jgi:MarR family transcriptional regulator, 2-MHQ and catechol-resistance regulon repressor